MERKKSIIVGISGGSGCGKTTIIEAIRSKFSLSEVCILSQDNYYKPRESQATDQKGIKNFDLPGSILTEELIEDVNRLMQGHSVTRQEYVFNNESVQPSVLNFEPAKIILIEGLFVFHSSPLKQLMDYKIFINTKENLKLIRRIKRDNAERNYPIDDVLYRYEHHVIPSYEKYILPYKEECDIVINNNKEYEKGVDFLTAFLRSKLNEN